MFQSPDSVEIPDSDKLRVLVVDDEPTLRLGFAYALTNRATIVETAASGTVALDRIQTGRFDIIILDLRMPELDGIGVIEALRERENLIPVILCSAVLNPRSAVRAIRAGVVDFLLKPVRPIDLRQVIDFVMNPERLILPHALRSARLGFPSEAITLLESDPSPEPQVAHWLEIFKSIRDADISGNGSELEEKVRASLPFLAFKGTPVS